jgi:hypothetical protein
MSFLTHVSRQASMFGEVRRIAITPTASAPKCSPLDEARLQPRTCATTFPSRRGRRLSAPVLLCTDELTALIVISALRSIACPRLSVVQCTTMSHCELLLQLLLACLPEPRLALAWACRWLSLGLLAPPVSAFGGAAKSAPDFRLPPESRVLATAWLSCAALKACPAAGASVG